MIFYDIIYEIEDILINKQFKDRQKVSVVSNILGQDGFLTKNVTKNRELLGRGPIKFKSSALTTGGIFLFSDVIIIAKCVLPGRRYVAETAFQLNSSTFRRETTGTEMIFKDKENVVTSVQYEHYSLAQCWDRYIQCARSRHWCLKLS